MTHRKTIIENIASQYILQFANFILPLITYPYLIRVLGIEKFGLFVFVGSYIQYFVTITEYGFNYSATRQVSLNRNDEHTINDVFSSVLVIKTGMMIICFLVVILSVLFVPRFNLFWQLYILSALAIIGNVIFPTWFFQGMEKLKTMSYINLFTRILGVISLFIFVHSERDIDRVILIQSVAVILSGICSLLYIAKKYRYIKIVRPPWAIIKSYTVEGWSYFISVFATTMFNNTNIFILGIFSSASDTGKFGIADKVIRSAIVLSAPVSNAIFPRTSALFKESKERAVNFLRKILLVGIPPFMFISFLLFVLSDKVVLFATGRFDLEVSILIKIMAIMPLTVFVDNIYGVQILFNNGRESHMMKIILFAGSLSICSALYFVPKYHSLATAIIFLITELIILISVIVSANKDKIYLIKNNII